MHSGPRRESGGAEDGLCPELRPAGTLGLEFDRETKDAWDTLLQIVSAVMLEAANESVAKRGALVYL